MPSLIPHNPVILSEVRTSDLWFLLAIGAIWEIICRVVLLSVKRKPSSLLEKESSLVKLQKETDRKRKMGPSAFVETSKLERQVLAAEKELTEIYDKRRASVESLEKSVLKYGNYFEALFVFIIYYGVPIVTIDALEVGLGEFLSAETYMKALLFPISVFGVGNRVSKFGFKPELANCSITALVVMWSSQVTVRMLMDALDAYILS